MTQVDLECGLILTSSGCVQITEVWTEYISVLLTFYGKSKMF